MELLRQAELSTRYYFGVLTQQENASNGGLSYSAGTARAAVGIDLTREYQPGLPYRTMVVAHEWGHNLHRHHVNCGNPGSPDPLYPRLDGRLGSYGWNPGTNTLVSPDTYDFMSYCAPVWVSGYTFNGMLDYFLESEATAAAAPEPTLLLWGRSTPEGGVVLEPAFEIDARASVPAVGDRFRLRATDADGNPILDLSFDGEEVDHMGVRHFTYAIPRAMLGGRDIAELRLTAGNAQAVRAASAVGAGPGAVEVTATRQADGMVRLQWDAAKTPIIMVRDARNGQILSIARGGDRIIAAEGDALDLELSAGVGSWQRRITIR
jgi:hypothetical protein